VETGWNSIRHTLRKEAGAIEKTALDWNSQGDRRRGRPKRTWRRTIEDDMIYRKIMERGKGDSWRSQRLEALRGYTVLHNK
jgi:hypothetical protein